MLISIIKKQTWRLFVAYNGTNYHGWQLNNKLPTIELELKKALYKITNQDIFLRVAGRTDAGVHARAQVVSCRFISKFNSKKLVLALSSVLPNDISVWRADEMHQDFHAKNQCIGKSYVYRIDLSLAKDIFAGNQRWYFHKNLNLKKMRKASKYFIGEHNFKNFRSNHGDAIHAYRYLWLIKIKKYKNLIEINIRGNAFCYKMIRIIVGTLVDVALEKLKYINVKNMLDATNKQLYLRIAPANGLTLEEVYYPDNLKNSLLPLNVIFPKYPSILDAWKQISNQIKIGQI